MVSISLPNFQIFLSSTKLERLSLFSWPISNLFQLKPKHDRHRLFDLIHLGVPKDSQTISKITGR